jgi:signal transduction histidine kinase
MLSWLKGYVLFVAVSLVGILLLVNIYLIYRNNQVIVFNKQQQEQAEKIKINTVGVIRSLHLLDLAVRSYGFVKSDHFLLAIDTAISIKDTAFAQLEKPLALQEFPMNEFYQLRDSVESYIKVAGSMMHLIKEGKMQEFVTILRNDPGYNVWLQYQRFSKYVNAFEDTIALRARLRYERALSNSYILQILLFFMAVPTLAYTAYYTNRTLGLSEKLRRSEQEKTEILSDKNWILEETVHERTREILAQNEEISMQNEEIVAHNDQLVSQQHQIELQRSDLSKQNEQLQEAKRIIVEQNQLIQQTNIDLLAEVEKQTYDLKQANLELIEQNSRLEQFAFIISHNLRAPLSRLVGLSDILDFAEDPKEVSEIVHLMVQSAHDLDAVIKDLTLILRIRKMNTQVLGEVDLNEVLHKVLKTLDEEIKETNAMININLGDVRHISSLHPYVESIFYNLISNGIKYRHPERVPCISIQAVYMNDAVQIEVTDNGLGIDVEKHRENLFNLYRRFHFHVEGKGLGLYLVRTQVEALGGMIEIKSNVDQGTTFTIYLRQV